MAESEKGIVQRPVKLAGPSGKEVAGTLRMHVWSDDERTSRVWKRLLTWWGCAIGAAVCPPHIPWLTIGLVGGPIAAWLVSRQGATIQEQDVACPDCGTLSHVDARNETWPLGARCEPCRTVFWISQATPEQPPSSPA